MTAKIEVILFDLGGVLIELKPSPFPKDWFPENRSFDLSQWFKSATALAFERGDISAEEFARALASDLGLTKTTQEILAEFTAWPTGLLPDAHELLVQLGSSHRLAALTNTNELHWPRITGEFHLPQYFSEIYASHRIQSAKPHRDAFLHVVNDLEVAPADILFFDDNPDNVTAAAGIGITSRLARSPDDVRRHLGELGLL